MKIISLNQSKRVTRILGYYVHLSTLAEVREQVLQYIPVVSRPLVLNRTHHPVLWSQVYADVVVSDFLIW